MLHRNACVKEPLICNQPNGGRASSRPPEPSSSCDPSSPEVIVSDRDLGIKPTHRGNSATVEATLGSRSPGEDLHSSLLVMSRRAESRPPRMIFSSSGTAVDHEQGFAVAGGWSPRCYACSFCGREFNSAQALGGHMNIHRRDRARLRTSTSLPSVPPQSDSTPMPPKSANTTLYHPFEAAVRENPTAISSNLNIYPPPSIISAAASPFKLVDMRPAADPTLLTLAAHPSHDKNLGAAFVAPLSDLVSNRSVATRSSATCIFSKIQNEAQSLFPMNITPHASSLLKRTRMENSSLKPAEALSNCARQASAPRQGRLDCSGATTAGGAQLFEFSQARGRMKRPRGSALDAVSKSGEAKSTVQRCDERSPSSIFSTEKSNSLHALATAPRSSRGGPTHYGLNCLDLELRLGQSSPSASQASAGNCCMRTTGRRPP